jgi:hypothetical protein
MRPIEQLLQDTATSTEGVKLYGRGPRVYANLDVSKYPRIWVHLVNPADTVHTNGLITSEYEIVGEVTADIDLTGDLASEPVSTTAYLDTLEALQAIYYRFINNLNKHHLNVRAIGVVSRREVLHEYDDNLVGYIFTLRMTIRENITYQCP